MIPYEIQDKVNRIMAKRRDEALAAAEAHNREVRARSEEIRDIDAELEKTGPALLRCVMKGEDLAPLRARNTELMERRRAILCELGYPEDYTEPHFVCPLCQDTGEADFRLCSCKRKLFVSETIAASGMGRIMEKCSFDNFSLDRFKDPDIYKRMKYNLDSIRRISETIGQKQQNLILFGAPGTGKTHLSAALAAAVIERGYNVVFDSAQNIVNDFEHDKFHSGYGENAVSLSEKYMNADLLIIDDLGVEMRTNFADACLYNLINTRQNRGLSTVISTNIDSTELPKVYELRICSRLLGTDYRPFCFFGEDYRILGK